MAHGKKIKSNGRLVDAGAAREVLDHVLPGLVALAQERRLAGISVEVRGVTLALRLSQGTVPAPPAVPAVVQDAIETTEPTVVPASVVGIFHRMPAGRTTPIAEVGDGIKDGQVVGYIGSMGLMHEVAGPAGTVAEFLVEEGQPVEYGQPLTLVWPGDGGRARV